MKKHIVLSVNDNPDYLYFTPLTCWAWRQFGWEPVVMFHNKGGINSDCVYLAETTVSDEVIFKYLNNIDGYRSDTITQISRLYAASVCDGYLMTGDIDMIPLIDYWRPNAHTITVWGHDLTGYGHYPICYIGMTSDRWKYVMNITSEDYNLLIKRDLDTLPQAKDPDFYKYWFCDQDLITARLKPFKPTTINRGQYPNGYARGRVDRGAWSLNHKEFIDAHLHHQIFHKGNEWKFDQTMELLKLVWPNEDFGWFVEYHNEFKRLTGHL